MIQFPRNDKTTPSNQASMLTSCFCCWNWESTCVSSTGQYTSLMVGIIFSGSYPWPLTMLVKHTRVILWGRAFFSNANNCRIAIGFPHENVGDVVDLKHHRLKGASLMMMSFIHGGFGDWFICRGTRDSRHSPTRCFSWGFSGWLTHSAWHANLGIVGDCISSTKIIASTLKYMILWLSE